MTNPTETARALLWRHGLPEDVIDGALCLHAQELAATIRSTDLPDWSDTTDLFDNGATWAADLIDPTVPDALAGTANAEQHRGVPSAVPAPAADRAALRDRIAWALLDHLSRTADIRPGSDGALAFMPEVTDDERMRIADAVLAVLPASVDRATVLREAADAVARDRAETLDRVMRAIPSDGAWAIGNRHAEDLLRRLAVEAPGPDRCSGCRYVPCGDCHPNAVEARDGQETQSEAGLRCVCGDPAIRDGDRWTHQPGTGDTCMYRPDARPRCPDCQMPHVITPGMQLACASILASIADRDAAADETPKLGCGCPDEDAVEHGFGTEDCTCIPFTRQTDPPRYLNRPTDTVDMISGWERGADCPHHRKAATQPQPVQHAPGTAILCADCRAKGHSVCMDDAEQQPKGA